MSNEQNNNWKTLPESHSRDIHAEIDTVLQGHKNMMWQKHKGTFGILGIICVFALMLAFTQRSSFRDSLFAEVLRDADLDELFGVEETVDAPPTTSDTEDLDALFANEDSTSSENTATSDDLESLFAEEDSVSTSESAPSEDLESLFAEEESSGEDDLDALFNQEIEDIEAITEAREISGLTPISISDPTPTPSETTISDFVPIGEEETSLPEDEDSEPIFSAAPDEEISNEDTDINSENTDLPEDSLVFEEDAGFEFPEDTTQSEFEFPTDTTASEFEFPTDNTNVISQTNTSVPSAFPVNNYAVSNVPKIGDVNVAYTAPQGAGDNTYYQQNAYTGTSYGSQTQPVAYPTNSHPKTGPENYLIIVVALCMGGLIWKKVFKWA